MSLRLLTEHHLEFLSLKGGCTGLSEPTLVKMPHCWKSHVAAQIYLPALPFIKLFDIDDEPIKPSIKLPPSGG